MISVSGQGAAAPQRAYGDGSPSAPAPVTSDERRMAGRLEDRRVDKTSDGDTVALSDEAMRRSAANEAAREAAAERMREGMADDARDRSPDDKASDLTGLEPTAEPTPQTPTDGQSAGRDEEPTPDEQQQIRELKARDAEVRNHENAHAAGGGGLAGSPSYSYQTGPNGQRYAVGGEVSIDVSAVSGDPRATINKMQTVRAAALAPSEPSAQDRSVASAASQQAAAAQTELASQASAAASGSDTEAQPRDETVGVANDNAGAGGSARTGARVEPKGLTLSRSSVAALSVYARNGGMPRSVGHEREANNGGLSIDRAA